MIRIQADYVFIFDLDNVLDQLNRTQFDSIMTLEAADWWSSPDEKAYHRELLVEINKEIELYQFDYEDTYECTSD